MLRVLRRADPVLLCTLWWPSMAVLSPTELRLIAVRIVRAAFWSSPLLTALSQDRSSSDEVALALSESLGVASDDEGMPDDETCKGERPRALLISNSRSGEPSRSESDENAGRSEGDDGFLERKPVWKRLLGRTGLTSREATFGGAGMGEESRLSTKEGIPLIGGAFSADDPGGGV